MAGWFLNIVVMLFVLDGIDAKGPKPTASPVVPYESYEYAYESSSIPGFNSSTPTSHPTRSPEGKNKETGPTTRAPTSLIPTSHAPTSLVPTSHAPTTLIPTSHAPTTLSPTTLTPTLTSAPKTHIPTTLVPTLGTSFPTAHPTKAPTTRKPTPKLPTLLPTAMPIEQVTETPTFHPRTKKPTTKTPTTLSPTDMPIIGTSSPTKPTTHRPTFKPSHEPTRNPSRQPTLKPVIRQPSTHSPTPKTRSPTIHPTIQPTSKPTLRLSLRPTTHSPTPRTPSPTDQPTRMPTLLPTPHPTRRPSFRPTHRPSPAPVMSGTRGPTYQPSPPTRHPTALSQLDLFLLIDESQSVLSSGLSCYLLTGQLCWTLVCDFAKDFIGALASSVGSYSSSNDNNDLNATGLRVSLGTFSYSCGHTNKNDFVPLALTNDESEVATAINAMYDPSTQRTCGSQAIKQLAQEVPKDSRANRAIVLITDGNSLEVNPSGLILQSLMAKGSQVRIIASGDYNQAKIYELLGIQTLSASSQEKFVVGTSSATTLLTESTLNDAEEITVQAFTP